MLHENRNCLVVAGREVAVLLINGAMDRPVEPYLYLYLSMLCY